MRHLLTGFEFSQDEYLDILDTAAAMKKDPKKYNQVLAGRSGAIMFEKPSLRTRTTFELAFYRLGGQGVYLDLKNGEFVDVTAGMDDLKNGILRQIKDENFEDDPLRILRAYRFLAVTGFKPAEELQIALKKYQHLALNPAKERIAYELMKLFGGDYAAKTLLLMDEDGLLEKIFPNVAEMKQVPPNSHHHLDLFHHVVETVRQIELLYNNSAEEIQAHLKQTDFGGFPRINHLKLAGFLHDIGKFSTWTLESDTCLPQNCNNCTKDSRVCGVRHRFIKHDDVGSKLVVPLLRDLKFSKKQIEYIAGMIKNHNYP